MSTSPLTDGVLIPSRRSAVMGWMLIIAGLGIAGGILKALVTPGDIPWGELGFGVFVSAMFLTSGLLMSRPKGGIESRKGKLVLHGSGDRLELDPSEIQEVVCHRRLSSSAEDAHWLWDVEIRTRKGMVHQVGESTSLEEALVMSRALGAHFSLEEREENEGYSPHIKASTQPLSTASFAVWKGGEMFWPILLTGVVCAWAGVAITWMGGGALSFVVGPPLGLLGFTLILIRIIGVVGHHRIEITTTDVSSRYLVLGRPLFDRTMERGEVDYVRVRPNGAKGWMLEWVGERRTVPIISGIGAHSHPTGLSELCSIGAGLNHQLAVTKDDHQDT